MEILKEIKKSGIIPVVKINNADSAVPLAEALCGGGLTTVEITFRSAAAEQAIKNITKNVPNALVIAGTILSVDQAAAAVAAGAKAIVSPGTNPDVVGFCLENNIPVIPGCATPSEVECCMEMGLRVVKLFPAEVVGGVKMLKALSGPYADMLFMPTGGITAANVSEYLSLKNVLACGGSWVATEHAIDSGDFGEIKSRAINAAELCRSK